MQRFLAIVVGVLVLGAGVGYFVLEKQHTEAMGVAESETAKLLEAQRAEASAAATELAVDMVRMLALSVADDVAEGRVEAIETRLAAAVQGHRLVGVMVLSPDGAVISSSDLRFRGRTLDDPATLRAAQVTAMTVADEAPAPGQIEIDAPLLSDGDKVGFMRAFVQLDDLAADPQ